MYMKRTVLILILCLLLSLAGCGPTTENGGTSSAVTVTDGPRLTERVSAQSDHTPVSPDRYYQYSFLSGTEKEAYDRIFRSIPEGKSVVDVSDLQIPKERANEVTQKIMADCPQFFFLSKTVSYTYSPDTGMLMEYHFLYNDGTAEDAFENGTLVHKADRSRIDGQIREFNRKVAQVLPLVPVSASAPEKEKILHDWIVSNTEYDTEAARIGADAPALPGAYNAYGALCEGKATCEGYAKLFQYLCYCVGIRGTQISGIADGGPHMWNGVELDGEWYLIDVTWDDPTGAEREYPVYSYYNLPATDMNKDHQPRESSLRIPECTSDALVYYRKYALYVNGSGTPENYRDVLDRTAATGEKFLTLYVGALQGDVKEYVSEQFFSENSALLGYIKEKGYSITFGRTYTIVGDYIYLTVQ